MKTGKINPTNTANRWASSPLPHILLVPKTGIRGLTDRCLQLTTDNRCPTKTKNHSHCPSPCRLYHKPSTACYNLGMSFIHLSLGQSRCLRSLQQKPSPPDDVSMYLAFFVGGEASLKGRDKVIVDAVEYTTALKRNSRRRLSTKRPYAISVPVCALLWNCNPEIPEVGPYLLRQIHSANLHMFAQCPRFLLQ